MGRQKKTVRIRMKDSGAEAAIPEFQVPIVKRFFSIDVLDGKQNASTGPAGQSKNKGGK